MNLRSKNHEVQYCRIRSAIIASTMVAEEEDVGGLPLQGALERKRPLSRGLFFARPSDTSDERGISTLQSTCSSIEHVWDSKRLVIYGFIAQW